ncbi:hypothetical protein [Eubacterium limosum]|uniref:hypothetical protein n=1 Tax=Eubacterium limosum TaxID=1736 RepID=UPI003713B8BB
MMRLYVDKKPESCTSCSLNKEMGGCPFKQPPICPLIELQYKRLIESLENEYLMELISAEQAEQILESFGCSVPFKSIVREKEDLW